MGERGEKKEDEPEGWPGVRGGVRIKTAGPGCPKALFHMKPNSGKSADTPICPLFPAPAHQEDTGQQCASVEVDTLRFLGTRRKGH